MDNLVELQERTSDNLSKEIDLSNRIISISSAILVIIAVFLGLYTTWMERKMKKLKDIVEEKEKEIRSLVDEINNDIGELCERIRRDDIVALLNRLVQVPRDIANAGERLMYVSLKECDYPLIKQAYLNAINEGSENELSNGIPLGAKYLVVIFQHFLGRAIEDDQLREKMVGFFANGILASFPNDIDKSTKDLAIALRKKNGAFNRESVLLAFRKALRKSKYGEQEHLLNNLKTGIKDDSLWKNVEFLLDEESKPDSDPSNRSKSK